MSRVYKTLEQLRMDVAARLGFGGSAAASSVIAPILNSFIDSAQQQIYADTQWNQLVKIAELDIGYEQNQLEYPADCDPDRVQEISVNFAGVWQVLERGIDTRHRSYMDNLSVPCRWEMFDTIETFPKADKVYPIRIKYVARPPRLTQDGDRVTINDELVFLLALTNAKFHYRQPDAQMIGGQYKDLLNKHRSRSRGKLVHRRHCGNSGSDLDDLYSVPVRS